jgi:hypothetical protein
MNEAAKIHAIHTCLLESIALRFGHLAEICEVLKREGLPPNEVSFLGAVLPVLVVVVVVASNNKYFSLAVVASVCS